jgi:hypothetical protein
MACRRGGIVERAAGTRQRGRAAPEEATPAFVPTRFGWSNALSHGAAPSWCDDAAFLAER